MTLLKNRTTIQNLQKAGVALLTGGIVMLLSGFARPASEISDKDRLGMALEYFQSGKYHEAILLFGKLDKGYRLNPRFKAYMGVCYFYETDYPNACKCFNEAMHSTCATKTRKATPCSAWQRATKRWTAPPQLTSFTTVQDFITNASTTQQTKKKI